MESLTVRISKTAHKSLRELADLADEPMTTVLERAIEAYRRHCFMERLNASFLALRGDPQAWSEEQSERALWDTALGDGLEDG